MDFYAILDQVIDLLRQRQRVTYRALQRHFDLDEDALNDLKDELLYAHPQVVDDEAGQAHLASERVFRYSERDNCAI